jgi:hypothetical protein
MNMEEFNILISNPAELKNTGKDDIRKLVAQYPYCQSLHLLYLKKLQFEQHPDFNNQLTKTAAFANDRKALYRLIYEPHKFEKEYILYKTDMDSIETSPAVAEVVLENESMAAAEYTPGNEVIESENPEQVEFEKHPEEALLEMENESKEEERIELQEDFILLTESAGGGSELSTEFENLEEENEEELVDEHESPELDAIKTLEMEIEEHSGRESKVINEAIQQTLKDINPNPQHHHGEKSFIEWLKSLQGEASKVKKIVPAAKPSDISPVAATNAETVSSTKEKPATDIKYADETEELDNILRREIQSKNYDFEKIPDEIANEIKSIDEFVNESHQHKAKVKEYKNLPVSELAKRSLQEGEEIITETMARVLAGQGKYKKASEIVEKLILIYPEKRAYFADLLNEFNKKIN